MTNFPPFGERLLQRMEERGPLCVGIDPHANLLDQWGLPDTAEGAREFSLRVLEAVGPVCAAIKPQVALYERFGSRGFAVLEELLKEARERDVLTIADAKRGDIGSTMEGYAAAWLSDDSPLAADSVTLSTYLGVGALGPAIALAEETRRGVFVLALTSNPEGQSVQHVGAPRSVAARVMDEVSEANEKFLAQPTTTHGDIPRVGSIGVVIGATIGTALTDLNIDLTRFNGIILAPGFGAQGADMASIKQVFGANADRVLVSSSRDILRAGPDAAALERAARHAQTTADVAVTD
ncbi:orotidine-5'-phosphate decarboxylase [Haematomicrobium sanguinis]|uniref:orotidine-5'-phosphate decarboxylase n=1 Tax=Haematomicrobium sanguinis TaxID=479106 RepID=UPI00047DA277|nr:orotidine-5'-phosphate decarboxylase [Haematomicrobium sanguinis]